MVPPATDEFTAPLLPPLQLTFCEVVAVKLNADPGCVIVAVETELHPFASRMVTVYVPAVTPEMFCVDAVLLHEYV